MRAWQFTNTHEPLVLNEVGEPTVAPGEVVIDVRAAGLCHSDVGLMEDEGWLPALRKRGGMTDVHGTKLVVTAAGRFAKRFGFTGFRVARLFHREGRMMCEPVTYHGSGHFAAAALSDGIAVIPPDVHAVEAGETIEFHPWR